MDTEVKSAVQSADQEAQYDEKAKRLLGQKHILAYILVKTVDEFKGMHPKDVIRYIEGEPMISVVPVEPGLTNVEKEEQGKRVTGFNTENQEIQEGLIRFDIVFYVRLRNGLSQMIINVEAQKDIPTKYKLLNRAVFYVSRLISSQKERDFTKTNYKAIKRVFSIWICMNMDENSMDHIHLTDEKLLGSYEWKGGLDLLNIVLIGISEDLPEYEEKYELHRLLGALLSKELTADEKLNIIETEYDIPVEDHMREDVKVMCNLSQGIKEDTKEEIIMNMYRNGFTIEQIILAVGKSEGEVEAIIKRKELVMA